tara:strand:- start:220 stop:492 length:273 start_codon:yes stop_codon:yes gene_type:complete
MIEYERHNCLAVKVTRASLHSGNFNSIILDIPFDEFQMRLSMWAEDGELIQDAFPGLNSDQREFLQTGLTIEEWDEIFGEEETKIKSYNS